MKNKATLTLMELMIMLLVFALAAALCLQAFAAAGQTSRRAEELDRAVLEGQNAAEALKACSGDLGRAAALWGGSFDGSCWTRDYDGGTVRAAEEDSGHPLLGRARITVSREDGSVLFTLPVAWQKGGGQP